MTLAFSDMVEAMAAEVRRQSAQSDIIHYADGPTAVGAIDLEQVARSGLVAIAGFELQMAVAKVVRDTFRSGIAAADPRPEEIGARVCEILKEKP